MGDCIDKGVKGAGRCDGVVKKRRILKANGEYTRELHSFPHCERHWKRDLARIVKRGATAADVLANL